MNNIQTAEEVREWAETIVKAKGDKYIPLAKSDMLAIAQYIVDMGSPKDLEDKPSEEKPSSEAAPQPSPAKNAVGENPVTDKDSISGVKETKATMMRSYALHRAGLTVQQAYDRFLEWSKEHPKEATVMDFSTGVKSANAAFAYWLAEIISVEVPNTMMDRM